MTFNKMRFPIVWITLALCVVLCAIEVHSGPVDQDLRLASKDSSRSGRQEPYDEDSGEENDDGSNEGGDDDDGEGDSGAGDDDDEEEEERSLHKRHVRDAVQKPLLVNDEQQQPDEDSVIPSTDAPGTDKPTKKPSVLLMLSTALDKAIAATTKLPSQQMASDAASVFLLLGQVFSEAIDKVIGEDGPEEAAVTEIGVTVAPVYSPAEELTAQLPIEHHPVKVEKQPEINSSQSQSVAFPSSS
ncbi:uncharacterized protein LOC129919286 [Episyrphus balteatus]|uniref:uncharacterized protein LOC129919286 n=1 Tax=Episyrphus balteatus TaxID=286459 RepID=UPI002485642F|nr:uncharacterized protein LOC129919286 [Episyrphus balteatus]